MQNCRAAGKVDAKAGQVTAASFKGVDFLLMEFVKGHPKGYFQKPLPMVV